MIFRKIFRIALLLALSAETAMACRADEAHNKKYHGDPQCLNCACVHHHDEHEHGELSVSARGTNIDGLNTRLDDKALGPVLLPANLERETE